MKLYLSLLAFPLVLSLSSHAEMRFDLVSSNTLPYKVQSLNWCQSCDFLGVAGQEQLIPPHGTVQPFIFDSMTNTLTSAGAEGNLGSNLTCVSWRSDCKYAAFGGRDGSTGIFEVYGFDPENPGSFQPTNTVIEYYQAVTALDWCQSSSIIAVSGYVHSADYLNYIQLYSFDETTSMLTPVGDQISQPGYFNQIAWCNDCEYLAGGGRNFGVFVHNSETNTLTSIYFEEINTISSLDWCQSCSYIAVGGYNEDTQGFLTIYQFDPESVTPVVELFTIYIPAIFPPLVPSAVTSVRWCGCGYIAVTATIAAQPLLMLYRFSPTLGLSLVQTVNPNILPTSIAWCNDCDYLAVGGYVIPGKNGDPLALIDLYQSFSC